MFRRLRHCLWISAATIVIGCSGDEPPAVDLSGVWIGSVSLSDGSGRIMLDLRQTDGDVVGGVELVASSNVGVTCLGHVHGYSLELAPNNADDRITADESAGTLTGSIDSGDISATWTATRLETYELAVAATYPALGQIPEAVVAQGGHLWFYDGYDSTLHERGPQGEALSVLSLTINHHCDAGFDGCGDALACSSSTTQTIDRLDPETGAILSEVPRTDHRQPGLACASDGTFWVDDASTLAHLDASGAVLTEFAVPGMPTDVAFDGTDPLVLMSFPHVVLRLNATTGAPLAAYEIPGYAWSAQELIRGVSFDGETLWTLVDSYKNGGTSSVALGLTLP